MTVPATAKMYINVTNRIRMKAIDCWESVEHVTIVHQYNKTEHSTAQQSAQSRVEWSRVESRVEQSRAEQSRVE